MKFKKLKEKIKKSRFGPYARKLYQFFSIFRPVFSYSQVGEDIIIDSFLKNKSKGFYVDVGAYHPVHISNTYKFYKSGWTGIQIEPNYKKSSLFKRYRPNSINLNVGVGEKEGTAKFFIFDSDAYSTFSAETANLNEKLGLKLLETKEVQMMKLSSIFKKYTKNIEIDFMSVDTEGFDLEVLKTNDWNVYRPHFVIVETVEASDKVFGKKLNDIYDPFMQKINYMKVADTYLNTIYADIAYVENN